MDKIYYLVQNKETGEEKRFESYYEVRKFWASLPIYEADKWINHGLITDE